MSESKTAKDSKATKPEKLDKAMKQTIHKVVAKMEEGRELLKQLAEIEKFLKHHGCSLEGRKKTTSTRKSTKDHTPIDEKAVLKKLGNEQLGYAEIAKRMGKGDQTMKKWLDSHSDIISKSHTDPKNSKSKVLYSAK